MIFPLLKFGLRRPMPYQFLIPLLYPVIGIWIDHHIPGSTILPSYFTVGLLAMSLVFSGRLMLLTGVSYSLIMVFVFFDPTIFMFCNHTPIAIDLSTYARTGTFFLVSAFCILFSYTLQLFRLAHIEMNQIISSIPFPLIISDKWGWIVFANKVAKKHFNFEIIPKLPPTFLDLFTPRGMQKQELHTEYKSLFNPAEDSHAENLPTHQLDLEFQGIPMTGNAVLLQSEGQKKLLTMIPNTPN